MTTGPNLPGPTPETYAAVAARRMQWDNLLWQVPVLGLTAQAFLFSISLSADASRFSRLTTSALSLIATVLSMHLMVRHRSAEQTDAHWLADYERRILMNPMPAADPGPADYWSGQPPPWPMHGVSWRDARNASASRYKPRRFSALPGFHVWIVGLALFGVAALATFFLTIVHPAIFK